MKQSQLCTIIVFVFVARISSENAALFQLWGWIVLTILALVAENYLERKEEKAREEFRKAEARMFNRDAP